MVRCMCTIVENNSLKNKHLRELKKNFRTYDYPEKVIKFGIQKSLKVYQTELRQPTKIETNNNLTFISTFNPNNPKTFNLVKSALNILVENNINGFKNIRLIHAKRQPPKLMNIPSVSNNSVMKSVLKDDTLEFAVSTVAYNLINPLHSKYII